MCLNSYYILEEVFLNITDEIFSNFPFILAVVEYWAADGNRAQRIKVYSLYWENNFLVLFADIDWRHVVKEQVQVVGSGCYLIGLLCSL